MKTTKHVVSYLMGLTGLASITLMLPAAAIENPAAQEAPEQENQKNRNAAQQQIPNQGRNAKPTAWVGIGGAKVSETLSKHLKLKPGIGLTIFHVFRDSAADAAGIKPHDVITEFDGQEVGTIQDLKNAVTARNPGDEVIIKFIHEGKALEKNIVLGKRMDIKHHKPAVGDNDPLWQGMGHLPKMERDRLEQMIKEHRQEMQKLLNEPDGLRQMIKRLRAEQVEMNRAVERDDAAKPELKNNAPNFNFNAEASVTLMDEDGSVTMKTINGMREVVIKNKTGEIVFEGPYQTEQDKAALPDNFQERLSKLDLNGFRFGARPQLNAPPAKANDQKPAE